MTFARSDRSDAEELLIHDRRLVVESPAEQGSVEFSDSLENSVPLESPRVTFVPVARPAAVSPPLANDPTETIIRLWGERLIVDRKRRKVGEVVIRKEIETHVVEIPVRREKLIVEQVSPEYEELAVVDLGQIPTDDLNSIESVEVSPSATATPTIVGEFTTIDGAIAFLRAIASESNTDLKTVKISVKGGF